MSFAASVRNVRNGGTLHSHLSYHSVDSYIFFSFFSFFSLPYLLQSSGSTARPHIYCLLESSFWDIWGLVFPTEVTLTMGTEQKQHHCS